MYDDIIGDRHSFMRSSIGLTDVVVDVDNKKSPKYNKRRGSFDKPDPSPLGIQKSLINYCHLLTYCR